MKCTDTEIKAPSASETREVSRQLATAITLAERLNDESVYETPAETQLPVNGRNQTPSARFIAYKFGNLFKEIRHFWTEDGEHLLVDADGKPMLNPKYLGADWVLRALELDYEVRMSEDPETFATLAAALVEGEHDLMSISAILGGIDYEMVVRNLFRYGGIDAQDILNNDC